MNSKDKPVELVAADEEDSISRNVLIWLNTFPEIPVSIQLIQYEYMEADRVCMALSTVQSTYIVERNIIGGYTAEYQFKVIYRLKPGRSTDARLSADELLNSLGEWAAKNWPDLGPGLQIQTLEATTRSSLFGMYENGDEDHQIFFRMTYKVEPF